MQPVFIPPGRSGLCTAGSPICAAHAAIELPAWGINADKQLCFMNPAACELFRVSPAIFLGQPWQELVQHVSRSLAVDGMPIEMQGNDGTRQMRLCADGKVRWYQLACLNEDGARVGTCRVEVAVEVTRWMRLETYMRGVAGTTPTTAPATGQPLTGREHEVLTLLAHGLGQQAIADRLAVRYTTVRTHVKHVLRKLQAGSIQEAVARHLLTFGAAAS